MLFRSVNNLRFAGALECCWDKKGKKYHELNLVYHLSAEGLDLNHPPKSTDAALVFEWQPLEALPELEILPKTLGKLLQSSCQENQAPNLYSEMK